MVALLVGGLFAVRSWALRSYDNRASREAWEAWRQETQRLEKEPGPVSRGAAKSVEPPTIVLLRDYFGSCLGLLWLLATVLFVTLMFMIRGVAGSEPWRIEVDDAPPPGAAPPSG